MNLSSGHWVSKLGPSEDIEHGLHDLDRHGIWCGGAGYEAAGGVAWCRHRRLPFTGRASGVLNRSTTRKFLMISTISTA